MSKKILILHAPGSNRDGDLARAFELAGGDATIAPLTALQRGDIRGQDFALLALPGGFSYGDALGAGRLWALDLQTWFHDALQAFVASGKPVLGICNGFQVLVKSGILPGPKATLTFNASGHFECRWVSLAASAQNPSPWLADLPMIECPVAHGEGRFLLAEGALLPPEQIALRYTHSDGKPAGGKYPVNPNGSFLDIAGVTNARGNVLGMMPHPEDHVYPHQYRQWTRGQARGLSLKLFQNGLNMA
ncbi:MAG: phosphoribosylformylglycinamidine synthase I [Chloroflexota bacterium]